MGMPTVDDDTGSVQVGKEPCPKCGSKDNLKRYSDGHAHCFTGGCGYREPATLGPNTGTHNVHPPSVSTGGDLIDPASFPKQTGGLPLRKITEDTLRRYGYFRALHEGQRVEVAPYFSQDGTLVHQKLRIASDKRFLTLSADTEGSIRSPLGNCKLFGQHYYGDRYDRMVVVTEGEIDAMSVAEAIDFKAPVVSVSAGSASAVKSIKANWQWLNRFQAIVFWFDDDDAGRAALSECVGLFQPGKVKVASIEGLKDASDAKQAGRDGDIYNAVYNARTLRPRGLLNARDLVSDVLEENRPTAARLKYPPCMPRLNEMTLGIHQGEVVYHVAGTGVGKSTAFREIQYHLLEQEARLAVLAFEDSRRDVQLGLMSIRAKRMLEVNPLPDKEMRKVHEEIFGSGRVDLFDPETAEWGVEAILGYIRYAAKALDVNVVFIDPLSFIAAGMELKDDERRVLDKVARDLSAMSKELNINVQVSHHLTRPTGVPHEEGAPTSLNQVRGSGGLANFAMGLIGWERNTQAPDNLYRVTQSRVLKARRQGSRAGIADVLYYEEDTGRLVPTSYDFPGPANTRGGLSGEHSSARSFSPIKSPDASPKDY